MKSSKILKITSPIPPSVNHYLSYRVAGAGRKFVQAYKSSEAKTYEREFSKIANIAIKEQGWVTPAKYKLIVMECIFYFPRIDMDANNYFKMPCDVLTDCGAWVDDNVVLPVTKRIYIDNGNPRLEMSIYESETIGIFEDEEHYKEFLKKNCLECKKNLSTCTILRRVLENRIVSECSLENLNCLKRK